MLNQYVTLKYYFNQIFDQKHIKPIFATKHELYMYAWKWKEPTLSHFFKNSL